MDEKLYPLPELSERSGHSYDLLYSWMRNGAHGVRLESQRVGGRVFVSEEALERFHTAINAKCEQPATAQIAMA